MIHIGYQNIINKSRVVAIIGYGSAGFKRLKEEAEERGEFIDVSKDNPRSLIVFDSNLVIASKNETENLILKFKEE